MCEIALLLGMFVMGIIALTKGEIQLSKKQKIRGAPARLIGLLLMIPLPASFGTGFVYGIVMTMRQQEIRNIPL